ncbi:endolysin, partial [Salmonella enterica]|nr:endolysin [Salmonella enterica]EDC0045688.1 endolysin [Salmonella enterica subsp. enterica serovar Typhimurium]EBF1366447.1 endolysin [Salmonella enterica]EBL8029724.1 endolysin [Salmonella enterica]EEB0796029.1 endolysin [Salmonella enterica subsp. enterica serovar Typhimurium]
RFLSLINTGDISQPEISGLRI